MRPHSRLTITRLEDRCTPAIDTAIVDRTLFVAGTEGDDQFGFAAGPEVHLYSLNGEVESVDAALVDRVVFNGRGGKDTADLTKGEFDETLVGAFVAPGGAEPGYSAIEAADVAVYTDTAWTVFRGPEGKSGVIHFSGSPEADTFAATPTFATLTGGEYEAAATGFFGVRGHGGTEDTAHLVGASDNAINTLSIDSDWAYLYGGRGSRLAVGFGEVSVHATGGSNRADVMGADSTTLTSTHEYAKIRAISYEPDAEGKYLNVVRDFYIVGYDSVKVKAKGSNPFERATLVDGPGQNRLTVSGDTAALNGEDYSVEVAGFGFVDAYAIDGGSNTSLIQDHSFSLRLHGDWGASGNPFVDQILEPLPGG